MRPGRRAGFSLPELSISVLCMMVLAAGLALSLDWIRDSASRAATQRSLSELHAAATLYTQQHKDSAAPASIGTLLDKLPAANSRDGLEKGPYIKKRGWTNDSSTWVDGWGVMYQYDASSKAITSSGNGTPITVRF